MLNNLMAFIAEKKRDIVRRGIPSKTAMFFASKAVAEKKGENMPPVRGGFTLLETMFAILIVSIGILGIHNGMNFATKNTRLARENFIGTYLAQEGVEIVKNMRDNNWVNGWAWNTGLTACTTGCYADYATSTLALGAGPVLKLNANGFYDYSSSATTTIYSRKITITPVGGDELDIKVDVFWNNVTTTIRENIYNWYMPS